MTAMIMTTVMMINSNDFDHDKITLSSVIKTHIFIRCSNGCDEGWVEGLMDGCFEGCYKFIYIDKYVYIHIYFVYIYTTYHFHQI
jgi:hypothetical protein